MKYALATLLLLAGCATSTAVTPIGRDTYQILRWDANPLASLDGVKAQALKDGTAYCTEHGRSLELVGSVDRPGTYETGPQTEVRFTCNLTTR